MLSSMKIQGENGKNYSLPPGQFFLNACIFRQSNLLSKNLKIFHLASKLREEIKFKVTNSHPYLNITDRQTSTKNCQPIVKFLNWLLACLLAD